MKTMRTHAGTRVTASVAGVVVAGATLVAGATGATAADGTVQLSSGTCETTDSELVTNTHRYGWDFGVDTRSGGHYAFAESGLDIWTDSNTSNDKVTGYRTVDFALSAVGAASIDYTNHTPETFAYGPGAQLAVDVDADGAADGFLVGEAVYNGNWWASTPLRNKLDALEISAPTVGGGGSAYNGTVEQWVEALGDPSVKAVGFSLGSGVHASGTINALTLGCVTYTFAHEDAPTNEVGEVVDGPVATNIELQGWDFTSESGTAGHYDFLTTGGVKIWTDAFPEGESGEQSAIAAVRDAEFPLYQVGELALDYTNSTPETFPYGPAVFATVDIDNDGVNDGELLYEEVYNGQWWANRALRNALTAAHLGLVAPAVGGGGSAMNGTVDQWLEAIPDATVTRVGFTLGSGVHAQGVLKSFTINNTKFEFGAKEVGFIDVTSGHQFFHDIAWLRENGISNGTMTDAGRVFDTQGPVRREAMAAFLYRLAGEPDVDLSDGSPFLDLAPTDDFYTEIVWAFQEGITEGTVVEGGREFRAAESISREAVAAFLYRAAGSPAFDEPEVAPFSDVVPGAKFTKEIAWMKANGITFGNADGTFGSLEPVTRQAIAAFLHRADAVVPVVG